jgi:transcriptional regulator with XRE-family HTH domain
MGATITVTRPLPKSIYTDRYRHFREMLKASRKAADLTQTAVAERLRKPPSYVAKYEGGERRLDVVEFLDVADAIGFDPRRFIGTLRTSNRLSGGANPLDRPSSARNPTNRTRQRRR